MFGFACPSCRDSQTTSSPASISSDANVCPRPVVVVGEPLLGLAAPKNRAARVRVEVEREVAVAAHFGRELGQRRRRHVLDEDAHRIAEPFEVGVAKGERSQRAHGDTASS